MQISMFRDSDSAQSFPAGTTVFSEGDDPEGLMYIVVQGEVDIFVHGKLIDTISQGASLGEIALVDKGPRTATAVAKTDCRLEPINARRFQFLVQQMPFFALEMLEVMAERLRHERELKS